MAAFTVIDHTELGAAASSWTASGISSSYDHLLILASVRSDRAAVYDSVKIGFNANTASGDYSHTYLRASTSTPTSGRDTAQAPTFIGDIAGASNLADTFANVKIWVPNYANTANFTAAITQVAHEDASTTNNEWGLEIDAVLFQSTAAITEVSLHTNVGDFVQYSTFTLYGVTGA